MSEGKINTCALMLRTVKDDLQIFAQDYENKRRKT